MLTTNLKQIIVRELFHENKFRNVSSSYQW